MLSRTGRSRRSALGGFGMVLFALVFASACADSHMRSQIHAARAQGIQQGSRPAPEQLPDGSNVSISGFERPAHLAVDPTRAGVWFIGAGDASTAAEFYDPSLGKVNSWAIGSPQADHLFTGVENAITVGADGDVWIGINTTVIRLQPSTGAVTKLTVTPEDSAGVEAARSPALRGAHAIRALALNGTRLAVAMSGAADVPVLDTSSLQQSQDFQLPANNEALDLDYSTDGTLGVALRNYSTKADDTLLVASASGSTRTVATPSDFVHHDGSLLVTGASQREAVTEVDSSGRETSHPTPAANDRVAYGEDILPLPNSQFLVPTIAGFSVDGPSGAQRSLRLPTFDCSGGSSIAGPTAPATPTTRAPVCNRRPTAMAYDVLSNTVWFMASGPGIDLGHFAL